MKNVAIWAISNFNWLWIGLAGRLKKEQGSKIHSICGSDRSVEYWKKQDQNGLVDTFITTNHFFFKYDKIAETTEAIYEKAQYYEKKYNTHVTDVLQTDRHLGRGFFSGGINHPKSKWSDKAVYLKSVSLFNKIIEFWEDYLDRIEPDLIVGAPSAILGKCCSVVARARNIPIRVLIQSKYQSYFSWMTDEYYSMPGLKENFERIENYKECIKPEELSDMTRLPWAEKSFKTYFSFRAPAVLLKRLVKSLIFYISRKHSGVATMGNYRFLEEAEYILRMYKEMRELDKIRIKNTGDLKGLSYVFYPLHTEPETSLGMLSPEFNEQLALIELIAKNLPAGTFIVIKEHLGAIGRRPKDFYSTIRQIPNAILVHPYSCAVELAKKAECVTVISSSLGSEAAILGIPVISFGVHNNFNFLPHVHVVESWRELRPLLNRLCRPDTDAESQRRAEDGLRYVEAIKASSFDLSWCDYGSKKRAPATEKEVDVLYSELMRNLCPVREAMTESSA